MSRPRHEYLIEVPDDKLYTPDPVGPWAKEKYRRLRMYAEMFSTGMKNKIPNRVYIDLFAGAGHAVIKERPPKRILTSAMLALTVKDPFSHYIFCDNDQDCIGALRQRVERERPTGIINFIPGDANAVVGDIVSKIPQHSRTNLVLSFCFVDPFGLGINFETIRKLQEGRGMDFLILLALGMDATRNEALYLKPENTRISQFLGDESWRDKWKVAEREGLSFIQFLATRYAAEMAKLGYLTTSLDQMIEVRVPENNMRLYYLAFFSKNEKGYDFWREVLKYSTDQYGLF